MGVLWRLGKAIVPPPLRPVAARAIERLWFAGRILPRRARDRRLHAHPARPHSLDAPLIVSLTSYRPRFGQLHRTLECLLRQTVRADRVILWIAHEAEQHLGDRIRTLSRRGLDVRLTDHLGPYSKLLPALAAFPDAIIVTADDDLFYPADWLEELVDAHDAAAPSILCHRAHRIRLATETVVAPYREWQRNVQDEAARRPSIDLVPTGCGGILYPPNMLHHDVLDARLSKRLCPTTDDFWFYWAARRAGATHRKVGGVFRMIPWPGSQIHTLHGPNLGAGYDRQIAALADHFGIPKGLSPPLQANPRASRRQR